VNPIAVDVTIVDLEMTLQRISAAASLALPFLAAIYQLLEAYSFGKDRPWRALGAVACAAILISLGWTKL
jgi:hypothetical protein